MVAMAGPRKELHRTGGGAEKGWEEMEKVVKLDGWLARVGLRPRGLGGQLGGGVGTYDVPSQNVQCVTWRWEPRAPSAHFSGVEGETQSVSSDFQATAW